MAKRNTTDSVDPRQRQGLAARGDSSQAVPRSAKPRVRAVGDGTFAVATNDSYANFMTRTGVGTGNIAQGSRYSFNPVTRNRVQLEWMYRGSWVVGVIVDAVAEDMTREGSEIQSSDPPERLEEYGHALEALEFWPSMTDCFKWMRLYGGAAGLLMVDGQDVSTPLKVDSVMGKGQFRGVYPLDRWSLWPDLSSLITEYGPDFGYPEFYDVRPDYQTGLKYMRVHYSRLIRGEGEKLPYWQRISENYWGMSVVERLFDRLVAFDSTTQGAAQLVYKSHLRTYKVEKLREIIAMGGKMYDALAKQIEMIRMFQSNEGLTLMDSKDDFEVHNQSFSGLDEVLLQFGQQLAGAAQIPLVRLFGQSPAGLNSTGESDMRMYYDGIKRKQEVHRRGMLVAHKLAYQSTFGRAVPKNFKMAYKPLWQIDEGERASITGLRTDAIMEAYEKGAINLPTAMRELRALSQITGAYSNITDDDIEQAEEDEKFNRENPPDPAALGVGGDPAAPGGAPGAASGGREAGNGGAAAPPTEQGRARLRAAAARAGGARRADH